MDPLDTAALPPLVAQILAYATIALTLLTALAHGIVWLVPRLRVIAMRTTTAKDDALVDWLARAGASLAAVLDVVQLFVPRVGLGKPAAPLAGEARTTTRTTTVVLETPPAPIPPTNPPPPMTGPGASA